MGATSQVGFRGRLIIAMVALVAVVSLSIGALFMLYLFEDEKARALEQLSLAERVAEEVLKTRTGLILSRLDVVVRDFGFRSAIASRDRATADSALANQSRRVGAEFALLLNNDGKPLAKAGALPESLRGSPLFDALLTQARQNGYASQMAVFDQAPVEVVAMPVEGAGLRAWLIAGFSLGGEVSEIITRLSGADVIFRALAPDSSGFQFLSGTEAMAPSRLEELSSATDTQSGSVRFLESSHFFTRVVGLAGDSPSDLQVLLLINRDASLENYYRRVVEVALLISAVLSMAVMIALLIARSLGRPVLELASYAAAIGDGRHPPPPPLRAGGELAQLRRALGEMLTKLRNREDQINFAARHDEITGQLNGNAVLELLRERFAAARASSLLGLRINNLSDVNDTLGLEFGDNILRAASKRLREHLPHDAELARTTGGEFLAVARALSDADLEKLANEIRTVAEVPLQIASTPFSLRCSLVTMQIPTDACDADEIRRRLNLTFEQAQKKRQPVTRYQPGRDEDHLRELQLTADLQTAIADNGLHMNYQPKLEMDSVGFYQVEALVRWIHPDLGFVSPEEFIFLAEQSGQITELTRHILRRVAEDANHWHASGLDIGVAVNLSALDLARPELADEVAAAFSEWQLPMSRITLEVTESAVMEDPEAAMETLLGLRRLGVTLSIDDFGTGHSSLAQLRKLPVQELKIDKSFILRLDTEPQDRLIVRFAMDMAHGLGLKVVAEGIENAETWQILREAGCELGQGFFLSRPVGAADLQATHQALTRRQHELSKAGEIAL